MRVKPLGPNWLPPVLTKPARRPDAKGRTCGRCHKVPLDKPGGQFCDSCEKHFLQIHRAGGAWLQVRRYHIEEIRSFTAFRIQLIVARGRLEQAKERLEQAILDQWDARHKEHYYHTFGRCFTEVEDVRRQIREHRYRLKERRAHIGRLPA